MTFDLRAALLRKGEVESARLDAFEFAVRARAMRLLAAELGRDPDALARLVANGTDADALATLGGDPMLVERHAACLREAHRILIEERGDPAPHRLA